MTTSTPSSSTKINPKKLLLNKYKRLYDKLYKQINLILLNNSQLASHIESIKNLEEEP